MRLVAEQLDDRSLLATITVTSLADNTTVDGLVTLREAIQAVNTHQSVDGSAAGEADPVVNTIVFQPGLTGTINLALGQFEIGSQFEFNGNVSLIIQGLGAGKTIVNGQNASRLFDCRILAVTFDGLTLTGGETLGPGGAIQSSFSLTIRNSTVSGNSAYGESTIFGVIEAPGGGIAATRDVTIINSTVSGNSTNSGGGGGIAGDAVTIINSTISGNSTNGDGAPGGGISGNAVTIINSTISGNSTNAIYAPGGGVSGDAVTIINSTISGNSTNGTGLIPNLTIGTQSWGGGISGNAVTITNSTISGNSTQGSYSSGGGISANAVTITNSTISGNSTTGDHSGGGGVAGHNPHGTAAVDVSLTITNSTISGNSTDNSDSPGGGAYTLSLLTVTNSTITANSVHGTNSDGGGLAVDLADGSAIRNSIVAGNSDTENGSNPDLLASDLLTVEFSLIGDNNGTALAAGNPDDNGNKIGTHAARINPQLAALANNGGPTKTRALCTAAGAPVASCTAASPSLNAGSNALAPADTSDLDGDGDTTEPIFFDQRGYDRIFNTTIDMGAFEVQPIYPWHNFTFGFASDVRGGSNNQPDGHIVADDVIAIINYINAKGSGQIPDNSDFGVPFGFLDTTKDNNVAADDVVKVINYINAHPNQSEGESGDNQWIGIDNIVVTGSAPNHAPSCNFFLPNMTDEDGPYTYSSWLILNCSANDLFQSVTQVSFAVDKPELFTAVPAVGAGGTLAFDPAPNVHGSGKVTMTIKDDGGTAAGGIDTTIVEVPFDVTKPHRLFNAAEAEPRRGRDVTGSTSLAPDGFIVAGDVVTVINYINAKGSGPIPAGSPYGPPYPDVNGDDNVVADDVLRIINYINARPNLPEAWEGEANAEPSVSPSSDEMLMLIAVDAASQLRRGKRL